MQLGDTGIHLIFSELVLFWFLFIVFIFLLLFLEFERYVLF